MNRENTIEDMKKQAVAVGMSSAEINEGLRRLDQEGQVIIGMAHFRIRKKK